MQWVNLLTVQGESTIFRRLVTNLYNLKAKKIPAGRFVVGDWLVAIE